MTQSLQCVFVLYPGITQLDFTGPFEVLRRVPGAEMVVTSLSGGELTADSGLTFSGLRRVDEIGRCDVLCVPGGQGLLAATQNAQLVAEVQRLGHRARYVTSVCNGSLLLGAAGLLHGKRAACHWAWRDMLTRFGAITDAERVVRDGNVITGGGVTAGIDFALVLAAELAGTLVAQAIQLAIEYAPAPPFEAGRPERAPADVLHVVCERYSRLYPERAAALQEVIRAASA